MKNNELLEALTILEREKNISKSTLLEAIESSLLIACKNHFGKADNVTVSIDPETCEYHVLAAKTVVEEVTGSRGTDFPGGGKGYRRSLRGRRCGSD